MKFLNNINISLKLPAIIIALAAFAGEVNREIQRFVGNETLALVVSFSVLVVLSILTARFFSVAIVKIRNAMVKVAGGDLQTEIPFADRGDEIGNMAKALVQFRDDLARAEADARAQLFKNAAFENSSGAIMMVDRDLQVTFVNQAAVKLLGENRASFQEVWPSFDPDKIVGSCIDMFHKNPAHQRQLLSDPSRLPYRTDITVGDLKFALNVSAVFDGAQNYIGNAMEWDDVTTKRLNEGVLAALDRTQMMVEFSLDGTVLNANENFLRATGYSLGELAGQHHRIFVDTDHQQSAQYRDFWADLARGTPKEGKFQRRTKSGDEVWIQGSYNTINDGNGNPFKVVKLASDITAAETERLRAVEQRKATTAEQALVVTSLADGLKNLADGDLTKLLDKEFAGEYEQLRSDFNAAISHLNKSMGAIVNNASGIGSGAGEISQAADDLSRRTERQAATLEETAAAMDQLTASVKAAADGAKKANSVVADTRQNAEESGVVVNKAVEAMSEIEQSSQQISQIIGVIDEIAFQTNLLALNAGVEAARAGDAGRGFAVVASEVRALAQRSSDAAKEIKQLISASSQHVETGVGLVGQAGSALQDIVTRVTEISGLVSDIATSSQEQAIGLDEINTAINQMDQVTQQNAAMVEQSTAASHSLTQEAQELTHLVSHFRTGTQNSNVLHSAVTPDAPPAVAGIAGPKTPGRDGASAANGMAANAARAPQEADGWQDF